MQECLMRMAAAALMLVTLGADGVRGDSWAAAQVKEVFCRSREWFVRVTPGTSVGEAFGFAGAQKGKHANAEFYRRAADRSYRLVAKATIQNPVAPVDFLVTDRGYLVTLDNWHNMGYGKAVASYRPDGRAVFAAELKDIFSKEEIDRFRRSVSSIWWRTETVYVREGQRSIYVALDDKGAELLVEPESGRWQYCERRKEKDQHLCRDSNSNRVWRAFQEPSLRK